MSITPAEARALVGKEIRRIVPDADLDGLAPDADLRRTFELDSLDFLGFVELLVKDTGIRIDDEDYPSLTTLDACADFLASRSAARGSAS
jgi:acyl carrier protein